GLNGDLREKAVNLEKAIEQLRFAAVRQNPTAEVYVYKDLTEVYVSLGDDARALTVVNRAAELVGVSAKARAFIFQARAEIYESQGKYSAALADYESAGKDTFWFIQRRRGHLHFLLGHYEQALADISRSVETKPDDVSNLFWIPPTDVAACPDEKFRKGML